MLDGIAKIIDQQLPPGRAFYIVTFDANSWAGQYHSIGTPDVRRQAIAALRAAADALEAREKRDQAAAA